MKGIFGKISKGTNKFLICLKWLFIALIVIVVDLEVIIKTDLPDWTALIAIALFLYMFFRHSKMAAVILDLLIGIVVFGISIIRSNGVEGCQQMLHEFYINTGSKMIAWMVVIGIGYAIWKLRKH